MKYSTVLSGALLAASAFAETHQFNFTTGWKTMNLDGLQDREVISCNGEFPWPDIKVKKGDRVELWLNNGFETHNTSLHLHGLFQEGTTQMDGPPMINQCPIAPGDSMLYNFTVPDQVGSYWYHSHTAGQYMDGMRAAFVIEDDDMPYEYDEEVILTITEWYHDYVDDLTADFMNVFNPTGAEPIPQNILMNNTMNNTWVVKPDTTYLMRIINIGGFVSQYLYMEDHTFTVIAVDGIYVEPNETSELYITVAQRYDVLIKTKNDTSRNYAFMQKFDDDMLDVIPKELQLNATNYIVYDEEADLPGEYFIDDYYTGFLDDFYLIPLDYEEPLESYDYQVTVDVIMDNLNDGINYAFFNNVTYTGPKVPTLATVLSAGENASDASVYGTYAHPFVLQKDEIVEIVLNNQDTGKHPFHLHGHVFQVIERAADFGEEDAPVAYNESIPYEMPENPMRRDTLYVRPQSYFVIRFKANNPGVWFFHCHIEWHLLQGLALTFIEDPIGIQERESLTENWLQVCDNVGVATEGNAAGNTVDYTDLKGQNVQRGPVPPGFTARGIVALVFSCIAGFAGCAMIGFYGMADIPNLDERILASMSPEERAAMLLDEADSDEAVSEEAVSESKQGSANEATTQN